MSEGVWTQPLIHQGSLTELKTAVDDGRPGPGDTVQAKLDKKEGNATKNHIVTPPVFLERTVLYGQECNNGY